MATLREIRRRIVSVKSTQQITKAMKMVASAKLRQAQEKIFAARPYSFQIDEIIRHLVATVEEPEDPLLEMRPAQRVLLVAVTADRGLCGAFNGNIIKQVLHQIEFHRDKEVSLVCIGRKGNDFFSKRNYQIRNRYVRIFDHLDFTKAQEITSFIVNEYRSRETDLVEFVYNEFKNAVQQNVVVEKYLPLTTKEFQGGKTNVDYIYEPDKASLLTAMLPRHLNMQTWRILLESNASEQGARMTAMENATDNAEEMIHDLTLFYNRTRQAAITKEISEIVGGAEAMKSA
ncbi:MAG TPA: ATP synthase F1 subunit gamma [Caldithrix sp.]|nr:ATP synthase F1 subunit gamma [Caldithrix sp.]